MKRINSLNELRGLSAVLVVLSHIPCTNALLGGNPGGFAVSLFYLLSGFLTVMSSERSTEFFLRKRILKLLPLYWIMTFIAFAAALVRPDFFHTATPTLLNLIRSLFFIPYQNPNGMVRPLLDVGWYLNVEVLYYLLFWISMKISFRYRTTICSCIQLLAFALGQILFVDHPFYVLYMSGLLMTSMGMLIYEIYRHISARANTNPDSKTAVCNIIAYGSMICGALLFCYLREFSPVVAQIVPLGVFLLFLAGDRYMYATRAIQFTGMISLSLYLSHEFVVKGVSRILFSLDELTPASALVSVVCLAVTVAVAYVVWFVIENKLTSRLISAVLKKQTNGGYTK